MRETIKDPDLQQRLMCARQLAAKAGREAAEMHAEALRSVARKGLQDFVTLADKRTEETIRDALARAFPEDGFLGEETGRQPGTNGVWIVDPIDGTTNYIRGLRHWGVSIAFLRAGHIELGCIFDATTDQVWHARRGGDAFCGDERVSVSACDRPDEALAILGHSRRTSFSEYQAVLARLHDLGMDHRVLGSAALGLLRVAAGAAELFYEAHLNSWDVAAGVLIAREAGGIVSMPPLETFLKQGGPVAACAPGMVKFVPELLVENAGD